MEYAQAHALAAGMLLFSFAVLVLLAVLQRPARGRSP
jgi:ABC-type sulfate transport system permease component